jgi:hypothetical protein
VEIWKFVNNLSGRAESLSIDRIILISHRWCRMFSIRKAADTIYKLYSRTEISRIRLETNVTRTMPRTPSHLNLINQRAKR